QLLTSCRLRKHIATVTQLLNLQTNEIDQLAKFMGHTSKTHESFYKLPQDIYQIAKVSKILQIMEKGNAANFKNRTLEEIDVDMDDIGSIEDGDEMENVDKIISLRNETVTKDSDEHEDLSSLPETTGERDIMRFSAAQASSREESNAEGSDIQPYLEQEGNMERSHDIQSINRNKPLKRGSRKRWSTIQKKLMKRRFSSNIKSKKVLRKEECEEFINAYKNDFEGVGWVRVKTYIYNEGRMASDT
ncbi:unnamed protein product, partial [Callosobruchus maculatus]